MENVEREYLMNNEPIIHSHITDELPENHILAYHQISCARCETLVHAANNETMTTWVEYSVKAVCMTCFVVWFQALKCPVLEVAEIDRFFHEIDKGKTKETLDFIFVSCNERLLVEIEGNQPTKTLKGDT